MTSLERLAEIVCKNIATVTLSPIPSDGVVRVTMVKGAFDGPLVGPLLKVSHLVFLKSPVSGISADEQVMSAVKRCMRELGIDVEEKTPDWDWS